MSVWKCSRQHRDFVRGSLSQPEPRTHTKGSAQPGWERQGRARGALGTAGGGPSGPPAAGGARRGQSRGRRPARPGRRAGGAEPLVPRSPLAVPAFPPRCRPLPPARLARGPARLPRRVRHGRPSAPHPARAPRARHRRATRPPPARDRAGRGRERQRAAGPGYGDTGIRG